MKNRWTNLAGITFYSIGALYYSYNLFIISGIGGFLISFFILIFKHFVHETILPTGLLSLISLGLAMTGFIFWTKMRTSQFQSHNPGLKILLLEHTYTLLGGNKYLDSKRIMVKALWTGVNCYKHKFYWSGGGEIIPEAIDPQQKIQLFKEPYGTYQVCQIDFNNPIKANKKFDFSYNLKLIDNMGSAQPFISQNIHSPINKLVLRVSFSREEGNIKTYKRRIFMSSTSDIPFREWELPLSSDSREACWEIPKPKIGFKYQIIW